MADNLKVFYAPTKVAGTAVVNLLAGASGKTRRCFVRIINIDTVARTCSLAVSTASTDVTDKGVIPPTLSVAAGDMVTTGDGDGAIVLESTHYLNFQPGTTNVFVVSVFGVESDVA